MPTKLSYTRDVSQYTNLSEGPALPTGNKLDVAIKGDGYFVFESPDQELYSRNGRFQLDNGGQLVNQQGFSRSIRCGNTTYFWANRYRNNHL